MDPKILKRQVARDKLANWRYFLLFVRMAGDSSVTNRLKTDGATLKMQNRIL
jgi:hypothetical protein